MSENAPSMASFSNKFKKSSDQGSAGQAEKDKGTETKTDTKTKRHPLLSAKTDDYVDDHLSYKPRITSSERIAYWKALVEYREYSSEGKSRRSKQSKNGEKESGEEELNADIKGNSKDDPDSWLNRMVGSLEQETKNFPAIYKKMLKIVITNKWDQRCLNVFILYIILIILIKDKIAETYAPVILTLNAGNQLLVVLALLMFLTQLIPFIGTFYLVHYCNDLVHVQASHNFQDWALVSCLTAQYVEFFYYGGRGRSDAAGKCQINVDKKPLQLQSQWTHMMKSLTTKYAKVYAKNGDEEEGKEDDGQEQKDDAAEEDNDEEDSDDADGKEGENGEEEGDDDDGDEEEGQKGVSAKDSPSNKLSANSQSGKDSKKKKKRRRKKKGDGIEYIDWTCIVCKTSNHAPKTKVNPEVDISFGIQGRFYKRDFARMTFRSNKASCSRCYATYDYTPPVGSAHLFPHNPNPHIAFTNYPPKPTVMNHRNSDFLSEIYYFTRSICCGVYNGRNSLFMANDWKLRKYVKDVFPKLPRYELGPNETYKVGEIVECKLQKSEFFRARIIAIRQNLTYDIRYDSGEELRFVSKKDLRLGFEKRQYAYRVEICLVMLAIVFPMGLLLAAGTNDPGVALLGPLFFSAALLGVRAVLFFQYATNFYQAGILNILRLSLLLLLPLLFLFISCLTGLSSGKAPDTWMTIAAMLVIAKVFSLPVLYMIRVPYAVLGVIVFTQTSAGFILVAMQAANPKAFMMWAIPIAPFITASLTLKYIRKHLHSIWDTCLIIRPASDESKANPSLPYAFYKLLVKTWEWFKINYL